VGTTARDRILIVDDEIQILNSLRRLLQRHFAVEIATSGEQALDKLEAFSPDLVISDFQMGSMSGQVLLQQVQQRCPRTVRILMSGYAEPAAIDVMVRDHAADHFVAKPFNSAELLTTIRHLLAERRRDEVRVAS
jgi:DNA-binding NtrC family response regulator